MASKQVMKEAYLTVIIIEYNNRMQGKGRNCKLTCSVITNTSAFRGSVSFFDRVCAWQDQSRHLICKVTITSSA